MEKQILPPTNSNLLLRLVDDFLFISDSKKAAVEFLEVMTTGK